MRGTKEFYDLMDSFEKAVAKLPVFPSLRLDREDRNSSCYQRGSFYQDGNVNQLFHAYMCGYQYGKAAS